jgi:hypothetical protein
VALIDFPTSISFEDVKKIGLKVPKNHHGEIKMHPLKSEVTMIGFPGYPPNKQHPKSLEIVSPGSSAVRSTNALWRVSGLGSFFDTKTFKYFPENGRRARKWQSKPDSLSVLEERIGRRLVTRLSLRKGCRVMACSASICV